jgi:hypothetical protein
MIGFAVPGYRTREAPQRAAGEAIERFAGTRFGTPNVFPPS